MATFPTPNNDTTSLMGVQNQDAVNITGGYIDGVTIGSNTAAIAITATTVTATTINGPTTQSVTTLNVGASGAAGTLNIFPTTASKGKTVLTASDNAGNTSTTINTAAQAGARTITIPDQGGNSSVLLTGGTLSATTGIAPLKVPLLSARNSDGSVLAAAAAAGKFGVSLTAGTSMALLSEAANSNTKTDVAIFEIVLPANYIAATNITLLVNGNYTLGGGTVGTHTLTMSAYLCADAGTQGATIIATSAQTVAATAGDMTFTITGATLTPGARLLLSGSLVIQDTGGSNITAQINSIRLT